MASMGADQGPTAEAEVVPLEDKNAASADSSLEPRADPDAQTTVTDFLDFTEYLPSDVVRSLTLIGMLDERYDDASRSVDELTTTWGRLPSLAVQERPDAVKLRANISDQLARAVSSRVYAHAEAVRMSENVNRHFNKANLLLAKLKSMMENYPSDEAKSPVAPRSPQMARAKLMVRATAEDGKKISRHRVPRVTVPGEVLAPYDIEYDTCTDDSDISSDSESDVAAISRRTPAPTPRIKLVSNKTQKPGTTQKTPTRPARQQQSSAALSAAAAANAAALQNPPPENAVIGSTDAPWLQLTQYELAKLRKRMKKNATWTPSETMVARELKALGRGPEEYREAKRRAEEEGRAFNPIMPTVVVDNESGTKQLPTGALSADALAGEEHPTSNRGMKLNEAKKLKREALAKLAAEEAEESARIMAQAAKYFLGNGGGPTLSESSKESVTSSIKPRANSRSSGGKRKRDIEAETIDAAESNDSSSRVMAKRTKTETPVLPPHHLTIPPHTAATVENQPLLSPGGTVVVTQTETPVPVPVPRQSSSVRSAASPISNTAPGSTVTTTVPLKPPAAETPVPLPRTDSRRSFTQVPPPPTRDSSRRETRGDAAKRTQQQPMPVRQPQPQPAVTEAGPEKAKQGNSRGPTPGPVSGTEIAVARRPSSRGGKAMSQEPPLSLAVERPRRASTARNTPVPELKVAPKRPKRPAPGVVSTTNSGGNSAVGKRKAAPKKKARTTKRDKGQVTETEMEEVDDEGNPIDPNEPRYCLCNRVSFGTMIQCDNIDHCKQEWFHLECVGLADIPARTTKWYCPDCRKLLNIGEKGEVSARGVKK
ncbi:hypothetical protein CDD82_3846 [Ophiocordyceps australis]|uniref:PHD-type domain-containing protein n=1 Tax=Ophiocordyceps australis TaxID=1399860 RepID=A0A2C5ZUC3_9HYPO|nr:hypothetical protein CDD82_3846 [Ophiocordyceps australis]